MKFSTTIFQDEDDIYIAECPSIPGCFSQGRTEQEAEKNIQEAIKECLEVRAEKGMPLLIEKMLESIHPLQEDVDEKWKTGSLPLSFP